MIFLENGNRVFGVEPNDDMRIFAEHRLQNFPNFVSVKARAEDTSLAKASIDLVTVGQALHWFHLDQARKEFRRILKETGHLCIVYNDRNNDDVFMKEYDAIVGKYARNRAKVPEITKYYLSEWFRDGSFREFTVPNAQYLDLEHLLGRMLSASYMPSATDPKTLRLRLEVAQLFESHARDSMVRLLYETRVIVGRPMTVD